LLENKRVEFLVGAKKCKRVWKSMKIKGMNGNQIGMSECGRLGKDPTPSFCKCGFYRGYGRILRKCGF